MRYEMRSSRSAKKLRLASECSGVLGKEGEVTRTRGTNYFLRDLLFEVLLDFFLVPLLLVLLLRPELTDLPLRPSLLSFPASMSCS